LDHQRHGEEVNRQQHFVTEQRVQRVERHPAHLRGQEQQRQRAVDQERQDFGRK